MDDVAIRVENLSKMYHIGAIPKRYDTLRDNIAGFGSRIANLFRCSSQSNSTIWALKNVSFEVQRGEVIGIIGRNGAGKTTLLKILSRITEPTKGRATINGRVGSLLEVGTGFHPELTGRENIYLNGAILGMKKVEIDRKFDEIVEFSGVEKFIDTPVKRYSSGMHMRLAFAVAAHLEPEILLVDEVLAVGDAEFQKKCLGKMGDVAREGRTVLFVSHNMPSIQRLCNKGIVLSEGAILMEGPVGEAVREYLGIGMSLQNERIWTDIGRAPGNGVVRLVGIRTKNQCGEICSKVDVCDPVAVEIDYVVLKEGYQLCVVLEFLNAMGQVLFVAFDNYIYGAWGRQTPYPMGFFRSTCFLPGDFLHEGDISINLRIFSPPEKPNAAPHIRELDLLRFAVNDSMDSGGVRGNFPYEWGIPALRPRLRWHTECLPLESVGFRKE